MVRMIRIRRYESASRNGGGDDSTLSTHLAPFEHLKASFISPVKLKIHHVQRADEIKLQKDKPKYEQPPPPTTRIGRKKKRGTGPNASAKLPVIYPTSRCKLKYLRMQRVHDHLLLEEEYVENQERIRKAKAQNTTTPASAGADSDALDRNADERSRVDDMRGSPMGVGNLEEMIDDDHAIVSSATGPEYYVSIMSFVDKDLLEPGASILLHHKSVSVVGVLTDDADPLVSVMKLDKAPTESYADIGGLESQIQEVREAVELPLLHPELYEEMGIKPPKGVILYGGPGTGKTLLAKAVANQTSATFLRIVGSELIQKYLGDGPRLVRQIFQVAAEHAPSIVFIDEIDAIGTKRYESTSGGEREVQRTMLELLNQLDGFDDRGDVKVILATNKIDTLDPALIRPGRIDRKILFENPDRTHIQPLPSLPSHYHAKLMQRLLRKHEAQNLHSPHLQDVSQRRRRARRIHQSERRPLRRGHQSHLLRSRSDGPPRAKNARPNGRFPSRKRACHEDEDGRRAGRIVLVGGIDIEDCSR